MNVDRLPRQSHPIITWAGYQQGADGEKACVENGMDEGLVSAGFV